jgi:putative DNA primase/helicase
VLPGIEALTILEETDDGGRSADAAAVCGDRWIDADREVLLARPRVGGDLNDALMEAGCGYASAAG